MGRKGSAYGTTRASGLDNGADVSDAVKESETAMFGRPKKLKKGRNRRDQSSDEDTAPLAAAKRLAATVSEEVDGATEKSSINQTRSQKRKQKKERKDIGGKGRTFHGSDDDDCAHPSRRWQTVRRDVRRRREIAQQNQQEK